MIWLLLVTIINVYFLVLFRYFGKYEVDILKAISVNYITCAVFGHIYNIIDTGSFPTNLPWDFYVTGLFSGFFFISTFFTMAKATNDIGISTVGIVSRMSMVLPVLYSLFYSQKSTYSFLNYFGLGLAVVAIFLSSKSKEDMVHKQKTWKQTAEIAWIFFGAGMVDLLISHMSVSYAEVASPTLISAMQFTGAATLGIAYNLLFSTPITKIKNIGAGVMLGIPNLLSLVFLFLGLSDFNNNAALFFPILNMATIVGSVGVSILLFKEKLSLKNWLGIMVALVSIYCISY